MKIKILPTNLKGEVFAPPSKSIAQRLIILCSVFGKDIVIKNVGSSKDVLTTIECIKAVGANIELKGRDLYIKEFQKKESATLNFNESGGAMRFFIPICSALNIKTSYTESERLKNRPINELIEELNRHGAMIENGKIFGKIESGEYEIDGSVSSQYVSGLLMALSMIDGESIVKVKGNIVSEDYINITIDILERLNKKIERKENKFYIHNSKIEVPSKMTNEGDYSLVANYICAGAMGGEIKIKGLSENTKQGDKRIIDIVNSFGASVKTENGIEVVHATLNGTIIDVENIIDLSPIIAVLGAYAKGTTVLLNTDRLRLKESDRVESIIDMLSRANIKCYEMNNSLVIEGGSPRGATFSAHNDHRIAMAETILASYAKGESIIEQIEVVEKTYPEFFNDFKKLGGKIDVNI